ncbi:transposase [Agrobacterium salinitolerans]|nr:transposase [Agrobacterium salinitolerans]
MPPSVNRRALKTALTESFEPGARVVDVARRHGVIANQLSDWRRQARDGNLALADSIQISQFQYKRNYFSRSTLKIINMQKYKT